MANSVGKGFPSANIQIGHVFCDIDDLTLWKYLGGDPKIVTSWLLIQGRVGTQPDTTLWGVAQAGAVWFYEPEGMYYGWNGSERVLIAFAGSPGLYDYRQMFTLQEEFIGGIASSSNAGILGWTTAGTLAVQSSEAQRPGIYRFSTGAVINTITRLSPHSSTSFDSSLPHRITWIARVNQVDTDTQVRFGAGSSVAGNPPTNGIYFEKLGADVTWFCVIRASAATVIRIDSGVNVSTNFTIFHYVYEPALTRITFYINDQVVVQQTVTPVFNVPGIAPYGFLINLAAADKSMDIDYFHMVGQGIVR